MRTPPESIELGDSLTQEEIEEAFNTNFGDHISGINPRRGEQGRRYILLFSNAQGPYSDVVTQGQFKYLGEEVDGDQIEDSPRNSALIDTHIPIHFFYKPAGEQNWEYQGLIDVIDHKFRDQDERDRLLFTMEHQQKSTSDESTVEHQQKSTSGESTVEHQQKSTRDESHRLEQRPDTGETFTAKVDRISGSGNGIIEIKRGSHINIGPVTGYCVGEVIEAKMVKGVFARCETDEYKRESYDTEFDYLISPNSSSSESNSMVASRKNEKSVSVSTIGSPEFCNECGSMMIVNNNRWKCRSCGYEKIKKTQDSTESSKEQTSGSSAEQEIISQNSDSQTDIEAPQRRGEAEQESASESSTIGAQSGETASTTPESELDMGKLRERAEESAVEEVTEDVSTTTTQKSQYNRSPEVKEYVKARADGVCEGCGEPAPFTSRTGEPYLHAHHIHELSDGGSDTPDTVVALCPNCHYRVHHGEDGDEYNQELLGFVQEKENRST